MTVTEPSIEFSIGTSAQSTEPSWTARTASRIVSSATGWTAEGDTPASSASSLKVPSGPR